MWALLLCILTSCGWLKYLAPVSPPIRSKSNTTRQLPAIFFPPFSLVTTIASRYERFNDLDIFFALLCSDKYMGLLTNDGGIRIWCLETMKMLCFKDEVLCDSESQSQR